MLQLGGVLSNTTVRITPRVSWWITAQHLLSGSSMAVNPNPEADNTIKDEKIESIEKVEKPIRKRYRSQLPQKFIADLFAQNEDISLAKNVITPKTTSPKPNLDELLNTVQSPDYNKQKAFEIMQELCNWVTSNKVKMHVFRNDARYLKICDTLGFTRSATNPFNINKTDSELYDNNSLYGFVQAEKAKSHIDTLQTREAIQVLAGLAHKQKRITPLLKSLNEKLLMSDTTLNIKELADILYSMAALTYYDEQLIHKISTQILEVVHSTEKVSVIGSILTSIGMLRHKDEPLLDELSKWVVNNKKLLRPQDINSLLLTLACTGYLPSNFDTILKDIINPLKESDMSQSTEWLDIVWSLVVINQATLQHYESVLNVGFLDRIVDLTELSTAKTLKLLNVNAAAHLIATNYNGPVIPEGSEILKTSIVRTKGKITFSNAIISALKILLPSDPIYMNCNLNTGLGFILDAEFCVDSKCTPLPLNNSKSESDALRIAVLTCSYSEFTRGQADITGPIKLYKKLLESQGYKVLLISFNDVDIRDKIVTRVKYINDNLKLLVLTSKK